MVERWVPATYDELIVALKDGRLEEGSHLDFKSDLPPGATANLKLARTLASFANDGGTLIFGVNEEEAGVFTASPIPLEGVRERIEQVATSRLDPPLHVEVTTLRPAVDAPNGILVVRIPASPSAPHMVEGRYFGRAGSTTHRLSDAQVRAIIHARHEDARPTVEVLDADVARDPIPPELRTHAHLHVVARPRHAPDDLVLASVSDLANGNWSTWFHKELLTRRFEPRLGSWAPDLRSGASSVGLRANGAALYDYYMGQDRSAADLLAEPEKLAAREDDLLDLEIDEDGTIHLFCARASDMHPSSGEVLIPPVVVGLVLRTVQVASSITELTGWIGTWDVAVEVSGLRGLKSHTWSWTEHLPAYSADDYRNATAIDTAELVKDPRGCVDRLLGRMLRGLGIAGGVDEVFPRPS